MSQHVIGIPTVALSESQLHAFKLPKSHPVGSEYLALEGDNHTKVVWYKNGIVVRSFSYEAEDGYVFSCCLADFKKDISPSPPQQQLNKTAVIVMSTGFMHIYELDGQSYTRSIPFKIHNVKPCHNGIVIQRAIESSGGGTQKAQSRAVGLPKFFILTDPMGELGYLTASSTGTISPSEDLMLFTTTPESPLFITKDRHEGLVKVYQVRFLAKSSKRRHRRSSLSRNRRSSRLSNTRKASLARTPTSDSGNESDISNNLERRLSLSSTNNSSNSNSGVGNNTVVDQSITLDRLASNDGAVSTVGEPLERDDVLAATISNMRKEAMLTLIDELEVPSTLSDDEIKVFGIYFNQNYLDSAGEQCVVLVNFNDKKVDIGVYAKSSAYSSYQSKKTASHTFEAINALPIFSSHSNEHNLDDACLVLIHSSPTELYLFDPVLNLRSPGLYIPTDWGNILSIRDSYESHITVLTDVGEKELAILDIPENQLVSKCFEALDLVLEPISKQYLKFLWMSALGYGITDSWDAFCAAILCCTMIIGPQFTSSGKPKLPPADASAIISSNAWDWLLQDTNLKNKQTLWFQVAHKLSQTDFGSQFDFSNVSEYIFLSLNALREEFKLGISTQIWAETLCGLLSIYVSYGNWSTEWTEHYKPSVDTPKIPYIASNLQQPYDEPPNVLKSLLGLLMGNEFDFPLLSGLNAITKDAEMKITPKILISVTIMEGIALSDSEAIVEFLDENGVTSENLLDYIECIKLPLLEIFALVRNSIGDDCSESLYKLLCRKDLCQMMLVGKNSVLEKQPNNKSASYGKGTAASSNADAPQKDIRSILQSVNDHDHLNSWDDPSEHDRLEISKAIFSSDKRFYEVSKLLQSSRVQEATVHQLPQWNEHQWLSVQQVIARKVILRTCANVMGRAALFFSARIPLVTEKYSIPPLNFNIILRPSNVTVPVQKSHLSDESLAWAYFHNGVAAGLGISRNAQHITGSWITFNKPQILSSQYSGFLLGLGLNGHLNKLEEWHIYNYLGPKFLQTSVALLIGMAASQIGSMNAKLTRILSVHISALLPPGSTNLNVSLPIQTAGIIGIGLLYQGSNHRRMSSILIQELDAARSVKSDNNDSDTTVDEKDEGYRLAAGISLGFINLGKGESLESLNIQAISSMNASNALDRLVELSTISRDSQSRRIMHDSAPGAIMALTLMFMKSNNLSIAEKLAISDTGERYDYIRPDLFYLRALAENVIMWNGIGNQKSWLESKIPTSLKAKYDIDTPAAINSDQMPYFNVISGLCMSIGLKYASTADISAKWTLIYYYDRFLRLIESVPTDTANHDQKAVKRSLMRNLNSICLALSTIMAGTGDLDVLRRLRRVYGEIYDDLVTIGFYMANQTALGILFMGGGQYGFSSKPSAIASLMVAFYPLFPSSLKETRFYLPALRHFWALAAENRCLVIRDVETNAPKSVEVTYKIRGSNNDKEPQQFTETAPCLIHDVEDIEWLSTHSKNHFDIHLDLVKKPDSPLVRAFKKTKSLYVYEKSALQGYSLDLASTLQSAAEQNDSSDKSLVSSLQKSVGWLDKHLDLLQPNTLGKKQFTGPQLETSLVDIWLALLAKSEQPKINDDYWNLRIVLEFANRWTEEQKLVYFTDDMVQKLKLNLLKLVL